MIPTIYRGAIKRQGTLAICLVLFAPAQASASFRSVGIVWLCMLSFCALFLLLFTLRLRHRAQQSRLRLAERERTIRELNDNLLQNLGGLILRFQTAAERISPSDPARQLLEDALRQSDQVLEEGRTRLLGLGLSGSEPSPLPQAFAAVGLELKQEHPAGFRVVVNGDPRELRPTVRDEIYRIGREAIANSFQHAKAKQCEMEISYAAKELRIGLRDDGCGVDATVLEDGPQLGNWGMPGMHERARKIGAHLEIWSRPGLGTEVELRVPASVAYREGNGISPWQRLRRMTVGRG
jgi:signal transduction histidine kinase